MDFKSPTVQKIAVGILIAIALGALWYYQMYEPNAIEIDKNETILEDLRLKLNSAKEKAQKYDLIMEEIDSLYAQYKLLETLMPLERDIPDFLDKLTISATNNGILIRNLHPQKSQDKQFYTADPYAISISTDYHKLGFFLSEVANFPFTTTSDKLTISASNSQDKSMQIELSLITYHISEGNRLRKPTLKKPGVKK